MAEAKADRPSITGNSSADDAETGQLWIRIPPARFASASERAIFFTFVFASRLGATVADLSVVNAAYLKRTLDAGSRSLFISQIQDEKKTFGNVAGQILGSPEFVGAAANHLT